jgi:hypothetical protein
MFRVLLFFLAAASLLAEPKPASPLGDHVKLQHAGFIGRAALGVGGHFFDGRLQSELFYGYVPKEVAGVHIHTVTIKNNYRPYTFVLDRSTLTPYIGLGVMDMVKQRYSANSREEVPSDYYHITGVHLLAYGGIEYKREFLDRNEKKRAFSLYLEIGTIDTYFVSYYNNPNTLGPEDIYSLAIGVGYHY